MMDAAGLEVYSGQRPQVRKPFFEKSMMHERFSAGETHDRTRWPGKDKPRAEAGKHRRNYRVRHRFPFRGSSG
jgi:hypothetical protein